MVKCVLSVNNYAVLGTIKMKMNKLGQHLAASLYQMVEKLHVSKGSMNFRLTFRWLAGHVGINGNQDMDEQAKAAANRGELR